MRVSELAKELNTNSDDVLTMLKSLKLKAKDSSQELSPAVISVLKSQFTNSTNTITSKEDPPASKPAKAEKPVKKVKKADVTKKKAAKKANDELLPVD